MHYIKDNLVVFCAGIFTIVMLVMGSFYGYLYYSVNDGIADMGAFLAGIFAPIIWIWFLASYAVQSSELKLQRQALVKQTEELSLNREELSLQRQELTLQRQAIEQSTLAQQGSEEALKDQSIALAAQLKITENQFNHYLMTVEKKKPLYKITLFEKSDHIEAYLYDEYGINPHRPNTRSFAGLNTTKYFTLNVKIKNIAGQAILKDIEPIISDEYKNECSLLIDGITFDEFCSFEVLVIPKKFSKLNWLSSEAKYIKIIKDLSLRISYSYAEGSGHDIYKLNLNDGELALRKVTDVLSNSLL